MRPVLLNRQDVDKKKAEERRQMLEEGMKLAERIDSLREMAANEESIFEKMQSDRLKNLEEKIAESVRQIEAIEIEIDERREKLVAYKKPLEQQWFTYIKEEKADIDSRKASLLKEQSNLQNAIALNIQRERDNETHAKELELRRLEYQRLIAEAKEAKKQIDAEARKTRSQAQQILSESEARDEDSKRKEREMDERKNHLDLREKKLEEESIAIREREYRVLAKELQFYSPIKKL